MTGTSIGRATSRCARPPTRKGFCSPKRSRGGISLLGLSTSTPVGEAQRVPGPSRSAQQEPPPMLSPGCHNWIPVRGMWADAAPAGAPRRDGDPRDTGYNPGAVGELASGCAETADPRLLRRPTGCGWTGWSRSTVEGRPHGGGSRPGDSKCCRGWRSHARPRPARCGRGGHRDAPRASHAGRPPPAWAPRAHGSMLPGSWCTTRRKGVS